MNTCVYTYPLAYYVETNNTLVGKKTIRVHDCINNVNNNELCGLWNFTHCPSDKDYCQPFVKGDIVYKQYFAPKDYFTYNFPHVIDTATGDDVIADTGLITTEAGDDANNTTYGNLLIDTSKFINTKCFYVKIVSFTCKLTMADNDFKDCVNALIADGYTSKEAKEICLNTMCADERTIMYSEPYCQVDCLETILIEGMYPKYDCNGNYYGAFTTTPTTNSYKPKLRIFGSLEPSEANIEETIVNNVRKQTKLIKTFNLMSYPLPYYVVEQLSNIFASKVITVEGEEYLRALTLSKNNEEGKMWIIKTTLLQECNSTNFTCD